MKSIVIEDYYNAKDRCNKRNIRRTLEAIRFYAGLFFGFAFFSFFISFLIFENFLLSIFFGIIVFSFFAFLSIVLYYLFLNLHLKIRNNELLEQILIKKNISE